MSITISFAGSNYDIPEDSDESWTTLTDYLVALSTAATTLSMTYSVRKATTTPQNIQPTDCIVLMDINAASAVVLPTGGSAQIGQFIGVYDYSGNADTNPITITCSSGQLINGAASYTIVSKYGGVFLQFNGVFWQIISELSFDTIIRTVYRQNNLTNASLIEGGEIATSAFASVTNLKTCSFDLTGTYFYKFFISLSNGKGMLCTGCYSENTISAIADPSNMMLLTDAGTGVYVYKSAMSPTISIKNRTGVTLNIEIHTEAGKIANPTVWS